MHHTRKTGSLPYIFLKKQNIMLEKIKFDIVIHNDYESKLYIQKANSISFVFPGLHCHKPVMRDQY